MIKSQQEYVDKHFEKIELQSTAQIEKSLFENCQFSYRHFKDCIFSHCRFIDCQFNHCNLSFLKIPYTAFNETDFRECDLRSINWTQAKWPNIHLSSPITFNNSDISHSNFYGLHLNELGLHACKAHDVDFRECQLEHADLSQSDLEQTLFMHSQLSHADFRETINYVIDPIENKIKHAKSSFPEVSGLLHAFDIDIEGI